MPERLEGDREVSTLAMDSRKVTPGQLFVCMPSANADANAFIPQALANGASAVLTFSDSGFEDALRSGAGAVLLPADQYNDSLWKLCKVAFGNPSAAMQIVGVTGTNGKTTTAWLIRDMLTALGVKAGYIGTLGFQIPGEERELQNTTPFAIELNTLLAEARDKGVEALAMEVSSHALAEKRVDGVEFDVAVFTNLTQDHLDFHGTMEDYLAAKLRLFTQLPAESTKPFCYALNGDDAALQNAAVGKLGHVSFLDPEIDVAYASESARVKAEDRRVPRYLIFGHNVSELDVPYHELSIGVDHVRIALRHGQEVTIQAPLGGSYNVENLVAAISALLLLGYNVPQLAEVASIVKPVPGRFEPVPNDAGIGIIVDYAHTPDALAKLLDTVREIHRNSKLQTPNSKVITVFGCGGDRDRGKRPLMAKAASERSDLTVVTSDNPRTEDPQAILDEVLAGIVPGREAVAIIDRGEAIAHAIKVAQPGDTVVIAGKGHENYQIIGRTKHPMDDRELARNALAERAKSSV